MWKNLKFSKKISFLVFVFILFSVLTAYAYSMMTNKVRDIGIANANEATLNGYKSLVKDIVDYTSVSLGDAGAGITDEKELFDLYQTYIKDVKYFDDKSGYLFVYSDNNVMFAHGAKPQLIGKDFTDSTDSNGVKVTLGLREAAKSGGGYVEYIWEKAGFGKQPKISYAKMIPGTNKFLATGVFVNDVIETEKKMKQKIIDFSEGFLIKLYAVLAALFILVMIPITILIINSMVKPLAGLTKTAEEYSRGDFDNEIIGTDREDEIGTLARSINRLGNSTKIVMDRLNSATS